jgi:inorganic pyrophosphatase
VKIEGWGSPEEARREIVESVKRAKKPRARKK